jgi:hypothetical protein
MRRSLGSQNETADNFLQAVIGSGRLLLRVNDAWRCQHRKRQGQNPGGKKGAFMFAHSLSPTPVA